MEESKEYYRAVAEAREYQLDSVLAPAMELLGVRGVVFAMIADVTFYGAKNGKNEKYNQSMNRLFKIDEFLTCCSKISDHNYQLRYMLMNSLHIRDKQEQEIESLKTQIENINKAFNEGI